MLSRKQMIGLAITRMMMQDKWAEKYDPDNRFGINQYDYNLEKDYLFALQREWKNSIWDSDKVEKYVNVLDYTSFDEYEEDVDKNWFMDAYALHFCSVSLGNFPMRKAHNKAIKYAKENGLIVSFDPNVRLPLFDDHEYLKNVIHEYIQYADILKISDEEVEFIFGNKDIEENLDYIFDQGVKLLVFTSGKDGAVAYTKNVVANSKGIKVNAVDTTGAGDGFIGCLLYQMAKENVDLEQINILTEEQLKTYLDLSNKFCSISVTKEGAIASYPTMEELR